MATKKNKPIDIKRFCGTPTAREMLREGIEGWGKGHLNVLSRGIVQRDDLIFFLAEAINNLGHGKPDGFIHVVNLAEAILNRRNSGHWGCKDIDQCTDLLSLKAESKRKP